jgi:hypothetical protein
MPKLQELKLESCQMSHSTALQLSQLTALTRLEFWNIRQVNLLNLDHGTVKSILQPLSKLQHLKLMHFADIVTVIPSSVTALSLGTEYWLAPIHSCFPQLTQLQQLKLADATVSPAILVSLSQLLHLQLQNCKFVPSRQFMEAMPGLMALPEDTWGDTELLAVVRELRQLQHLSVLNYELAVAFEEVQAADCSALTASSHLTHLGIFCEEEQPLPVTAVQHMFPAGKVLPQLQHLELCCGDRRYNWQDVPALMTPAELCSIIRACPAICSLDIENAMSPFAEDSAVASRQQLEDALLQLPASCCTLSVGGEPFDDAVAAVIAQLSQLTSLYWRFADGLTDAGLERLTALQGLQLLSLQECPNNEVVPKDEDTMSDAYEIKAAEQVRCTCPDCAVQVVAAHPGAQLAAEKDQLPAWEVLHNNYVACLVLSLQLCATAPSNAAPVAQN